MSVPEVGLIGDIGATNARFALVQPDGSTIPPRVYALNDYPSLSDVIDAYLAEESPERLGQAVLAVAAPVTGDQITLTNHTWTFSIEALRRHVGLKRLRVINDFAANALAIPHLGESDRIQIGVGSPVSDAPIALIGPGTGLGVSSLVPTQSSAVPIPGEGGHVTMAPAVPAGPFTPAQITNPRIWDEDPRTREATAMFCAMLGTVASNLALTLGARGGIYVAGGIVSRLGPYFAQSEFRARFEAKGRFRGYLAAIPTYVIARPLPALLGATALLKQP